MFKPIFVLSTLLVLNESALVQKCNMSDGECKKIMYRNLIGSIAAGVPQKGIPPIDPMPLAGVTAKFPDSMELTLVDGQITDMAKCYYDSFKTNLERRSTRMHIKCQINIKGQYKIKGGENQVDGLGEGNIFIENLSIDMNMHYHIRKGVGNEIYLTANHTEIAHTFKITEKPAFAGDLGLGDLNKKVVDYMNANPDVYKMTFIPIITEKVMEFYYKFTENYLKAIPAKTIISSDLTPYIEN